MSSEKQTCYLFGGKSLLIQCAEILRNNEFRIEAIISDDVSIQNWSGEHQLPCFTESQTDRLSALGSVDYIFSITHLNIIPANILSLARQKAINFHDGLLPGYAGINVTSWAIINQEPRHGITWHEMNEAVDRGDIYRQVEFDIAADETSFTLNAKCYEAAVNSFQELLNLLVDEQFTPTPLQGDSRLFKKCQRPSGMSIVDWRQTASKIEALVRALDYGYYFNPLSKAKLLCADEVYYLNQVAVCAAASYRPQDLSPGKVLSCKEKFVVAAGDEAIEVIALLSQSGEVLSADDFVKKTGLSVGDNLPLLSVSEIALLTKLDSQLCRGELSWKERLVQVEQPHLPFISLAGAKKDNVEYQSITQPLPESLDVQKAKSALVLFISKLSQKSIFSLCVEQNQLDVLPSLLVDTCPPVEFDIDYQSTCKQALDYCQTQLSSIGVKSYCKDLLVREANLPNSLAKATVIIGELSQDSSFKDAELKILLDIKNSSVQWVYDNSLYTEKHILKYQELLTAFSESLNQKMSNTFASVSLLNDSQRQVLLNDWNQTQTEYEQDICVHQLFERQVNETPEAIALSFAGREITYRELNQQANQVAHYLIEKGIQPDQLVGLLVERSAEMIIAMMGILKSGAAYLPLDPSYPRERIDYMLQDGEVSAVISQAKYQSIVEETRVPLLLIDQDDKALSQLRTENLESQVRANNLAYSIYTSGSTGKPKGVMVEHRNVVNFFKGMDDQLGQDAGVWLAVTSISFDISVLEIFWTLVNGFEVALYSDSLRKANELKVTRLPDVEMAFSLFYWNVADEESDYDEDVYRLLMESAKYGDQNGFSAVWTPERHFQAFGGLYPNPSVISAALAAATDNIQIRAGSCVVPLHHPIRIAEEWSVVDNLSHGRVGLSVAAGWQPNDFVLMPQNHAEAKNVMFESLKTIKKLWQGETLEFPGPKGNMVQVRTLPRPVQKELPVWVTVASNPETFLQAGEVGANVLTHLLGQSVETVADNIKLYRNAYREAGHAGEGSVTLLLHTLVAETDEEAKEKARAPMKKYLKSAMFLVKAATWHFPTFKTMSEESGKTLDDFFDTITDEDMDAVLEFAFERYYSTSGLFGSVERCIAMVDRLKEIGVNDIGCLIDYGLDTDSVLAHLPYLNQVRQRGQKQVEIEAKELGPVSIPEIVDSRRVTHMQCTPSMANMLLAEEDTRNALTNIDYMMVGGEVFPAKLAKNLKSLVRRRVTNMYGPTETTIWSSTAEVDATDSIPIGRPIANTQIYVLDEYLNPVPVGMPGELYIAGDGVVRGYYKRENLTAERFVSNPFVDDKSARMYRTGDLAKYTVDGILEYIGRVDQQIKIRGYRIELGEIESQLQRIPSVREAVVVLKAGEEDKRLVAYLIFESDVEEAPSLLKEKLMQVLPEFMVPSHYVVIREMPKTPNGKIDRNALPDPTPHRVVKGEFIAPKSEVSVMIAEIWSEVLETPQIGLNDNFFDLGGHSLSAVQVAHKIRQLFQVDFPLQTIFIKRNLAELSAHVELSLIEQVSGDELEELLMELED